MKSEFEKFLLTLPACEKVPLENGTANAIFRIGPYLVREKKEDVTDLPFQSPSTEKEAYQVLGNHPHVPTLLYYDDFGNKVEAFIEGHPFDPNNEEDLQKIAIALRHIHAIPVAKSLTHFKAVERYRYYQGIATDSLSSDPALEEEVLQKALPYLAKEGLCLGHNDLWQGNIIVNEERAYLLDFEFAQAGFPEFDRASLIEENSLNKQQASFFLNCYYEGEPSPKTKEEITALVNFHHMLWYYWATARYKETGNKGFLSIAKIKKDAFLSIKEK